MRHGKILDTVPEGSVQYSDDSAMIKFKKVRFDDRGEYTCFAANQVSSVNQTTIVNVLGKHGHLIAILCSFTPTLR